jgi:hypothetical protein
VHGQLLRDFVKVRPEGVVLEAALQAVESGCGEVVQLRLEETERRTPNEREREGAGYAPLMTNGEGGHTKVGQTRKKTGVGRLPFEDTRQVSKGVGSLPPGPVCQDGGEHREWVGCSGFQGMGIGWCSCGMDASSRENWAGEVPREGWKGTETREVGVKRLVLALPVRVGLEGELVQLGEAGDEKLENGLRG